MDYFYSTNTPFHILHYCFWSGSKILNRAKHPTVGAHHLLWCREGEEPGIAAAVRDARRGHDNVEPRTSMDALVEGGVQRHDLF